MEREKPIKTLETERCQNTDILYINKIIIIIIIIIIIVIIYIIKTFAWDSTCLLYFTLALTRLPSNL